LNVQGARPRDDTQFFRRICLLLRTLDAVYLPISAFPDDLDPYTVSPELKKMGSDWIAVFNPKIRKTPNLNLEHTLVHER
jgi:hypothetical protein